MTLFDKLLRISLNFKRMSNKRILVRYEWRLVLCKYQRSFSARYSGHLPYDINSQVLDVEADRLSQQVQQRTVLERAVILLTPIVKSSFERLVIKKSKVCIIIIMRINEPWLLTRLALSSNQVNTTHLFGYT